MIKPKPLKIVCTDGVELAALLLEPKSPKAVIQLNGGTGFKKEFYLAFAQYLTEQGYVTIIYDYRGTCESAPTDMRDCDYTFLDYGTKDMPAVLQYLEEQYPHLPKLIFGHSVGGQMIGHIPNIKPIKGLVCMGTSVGYIRNMPLGYRLKSWYFFKIFSPLSIQLTGYVRAKKFGIMEDLPRKVVQDWSAWCSAKNYFFDKKYYGITVPKGQYQDYTFPVHVFWTTDDPICNKRNLDIFWQQVKSTQSIDFQKLIPSDWHTKSIGHHGFFKKNFKDTLWREALNKLDSFLAYPSV
jgi:predicted alpha/beta hydrolase